MANTNDLTDKMEKCVTEEKKNKKNWNDLPDEMKEMVVKEMTFETRTRLKACSKLDKYIVESTPISYDKLNIRVTKNRSNFYANLKIHSKLNISFQITVERNNVIIVRSPRPMIMFLRYGVEKHHTKRVPCSSEEDANKLVENIIKKMIFDGNIRFNTAALFINAPGFLENTNIIIHAKHIIIYELNSQTIEWLKKVAPKVESVSMTDEWGCYNKVEGLETIPAVVNAQKIEIEQYCDISDDQLVSFKCTSLKIGRPSNISGKGMNRLIKKAIANDYPIETRFDIRLKHGYVLNDIWKEITEGLNVEGVVRTHSGRMQREGRSGIIRMRGDKQMTIAVRHDCFEAKIHEKF